MIYKDITLDPFQEEAIQHIDQGDSVIVAAPTGAGKTLIAEYAIDKSLREGKRLIYTAPIKALSNQKFRDFSTQYGDRIGIKTGDVTLNPDAQVILMTTEIFRNTIFENPESLHDVGFVVFDEIHYLDDIERGTVWEESIIFAPEHIRIICLSATVPNIQQLARWMRHVRKAPVHVVLEAGRPVPLKPMIYVPGMGVKRLKDLRQMELEGRRLRPFSFRDHPRWRGELIDELIERDRLPVLYFAFNRKDCETFAAALSTPLLNDDEKKKILNLYDDLCRRFVLEPDAVTQHIRTLLAKGTAYHHAGLLPTLKEIVERIFTTGMLKLLFATETFAMGINMPARTVVFDTVHKFNGVSRAFMKTREHQQMSGRAGRRGIDEVGYTYSIAEWPEVKAASLERIIYGEPEPIRSQFNLSYAILLTSYHHLGEKIFLACKKSFGNFQSQPSQQQTVHGFKAKLETVEKKLNVLRRLGYIDGQKVTDKGHFAAGINGYELQVTELYSRGALKDIRPDLLNVVTTAIVFESKRADWYRNPNIQHFDGLKRTCLRIVSEILGAEKRMGLSEMVKDIDFSLSEATYAWSTGCEFNSLEAAASSADGDLVRTFRLAIQLLRQIGYAHAAHPLVPSAGPNDFSRTISQAIGKMCRDVVDAERQLRLGIGETPEAPAEGEARPGGRPPDA